MIPWIQVFTKLAEKGILGSVADTEGLALVPINALVATELSTSIDEAENGLRGDEDAGELRREPRFL